MTILTHTTQLLKQECYPPIAFNPLPPIQLLNWEIDISHLERLFMEKNYCEIVHNSELFWFAFCKVFNDLNIKTEHFAVFLENNLLKISGPKGQIQKLKAFIEQLRNFFQKNEEKSQEFILVAIRSGFEYILKEKQDVIILDNFANEVRLSQLWFNSHIKPSLHAFCTSLGAACFEIKIQQNIRTFEKINNMKAFKIKWTQGKHLLYRFPISLLLIPERSAEERAISQLYQDETSLDWTIVAKGNEIVRIHSKALLINGGEMIKAMLSNSMRELTEKTIHFEGFSIHIVRIFVDFIYLGEESLNREHFLNATSDLYELLRMAHTYQNHTLIHHCTNLISMVAPREDAEIIKQLAEIYNSQHLHDLHYCLG